MSKQLQQSPCSSSSDSDSSFDYKQQKSNLFAKLEEMSKAIDGYKELKDKGGVTDATALLSPNQSNRNLNNQSSQKLIDNQEQMVNDNIISPKDPCQEFEKPKAMKQKYVNDTFSEIIQEQPKLQTNQPFQSIKHQELFQSNSNSLSNNYSGQRFDQEPPTPHLSTLNNEHEFMMNTLASTQTFNQYLDAQPSSPKFNQQQINDTMNQQYLMSLTVNTIDQQLQCDLDYQKHQDLIQNHKSQLQNFEGSLNLLKEQLKLQQDIEGQLKEEINLMGQEILQLRNERSQYSGKEEELLMQVDQLVQVIEDQTQELRIRDRQILEYQQQEQEPSAIQIQSMQELHNREKGDMQKQIREMQEKMATEFSKKRKIKQEYEDQVVELNEELDYFREKYHEMKDLLQNCTDQLKNFEDLNKMRNDVIEKLEKDNIGMRQILTQNGLTTPQPLVYTSFSETNREKSFQQSTQKRQYIDESVAYTPAKEDKSFSLHLQQVNCDRSRHISRDLSHISERNESTFSHSLQNEARNIPQQPIYQQTCQSERKPTYINKKPDFLSTYDLQEEQDKFLNVPQQQMSRLYSQKQTPKGSENIEIQFNQQISQSSVKQKPINNSGVYLAKAREQKANFRALNDSRRDQDEEDPTDLNQASISQYDKTYQQRRKIIRNPDLDDPHNQTQTFTQYLSPHKEEDYNKITFSDTLSPQAPQRQYQPYSQPTDYSKSEQKYQPGRYQRETLLKTANKENSYLTEYPRGLQSAVNLHSDQYDQEYLNIQENQSLTIAQSAAKTNKQRAFRMIDQETNNCSNYQECGVSQQRVEYQNQEYSLKNRKVPFDYMQPTQKYASQLHQDEFEQPKLKQYQSSYTFSKISNNQQLNDSLILQDPHQAQTLLDSNIIFNTISSTHSSQQQQKQPDQQIYQHSNKNLSMRDEIKKLHNNINSLRQKMNIPSNKLKNSKASQNGSGYQNKRQDSNGSYNSSLKTEGGSPSQSILN